MFWSFVVNYRRCVFVTVVTKAHLVPPKLTQAQAPALVTQDPLWSPWYVHRKLRSQRVSGPTLCRAMPKKGVEMRL